MRWSWFAVAYALLGAVAWVIAVAARGASPFLHPQPWLALPPHAAHTYSLALGVAFGGLVVMATRASVERFGWARRLHGELRPVARSMDGTFIVLLALASAFGEELLFRGLLQPWLGLVPQALLFGVVHQMRGPSRWVWVAWATAVGLLLGVLYRLTGSLVGPIGLHALVNAVNLQYLRSHDAEPRRRSLGGLLDSPR